jgi:hypothetical protein
VRGLDVKEINAFVLVHGAPWIANFALLILQFALIF